MLKRDSNFIYRHRIRLEKTSKIIESNLSQLDPSSSKSRRLFGMHQVLYCLPNF